MADDDLLTVPEVAVMLRLNDQTVRKWLREGRLPGRSHLGTRTAGYRIRRSDVTAFLDAQRGEVAAA